jgi:hypothetical protein
MAMMALYIVILCSSAYFASFAGGRVGNRILRELDASRERTQLATALSLLMFFTVVSAPAGVMVAALLMIVLGFLKPGVWLLGERQVVAALALAVLVAVIGISAAPGIWPSMLPEMVWWLVAALVVAVCLLAANRCEAALEDFSIVAMASVAPLILAPLLFPDAHSSLAIDAALLISALLGGVVASSQPQRITALLKLPVALMIAFGVVQALRYGAWPLAMTSLLVWLGGLIAAQQSSRKVLA